MMDLTTAHLETFGLALLAGSILGAVFFGGLWLTVSRVLPTRKPRHPQLLLLCSFAVRGAILVAGLWWVGRGAPARMLACALGIIAVRAMVIRLAGGSGQRHEAEVR